MPLEAIKFAAQPRFGSENPDNSKLGTAENRSASDSKLILNKSAYEELKNKLLYYFNLLNYEREKRKKLQEQNYALAKEHIALEKNLQSAEHSLKRIKKKVEAIETDPQTVKAIFERLHLLYYQLDTLTQSLAGIAGSVAFSPPKTPEEKVKLILDYLYPCRSLDSRLDGLFGAILQVAAGVRDLPTDATVPPPPAFSELAERNAYPWAISADAPIYIRNMFNSSPEASDLLRAQLVAQELIKVENNKIHQGDINIKLEGISVDLGEIRLNSLEILSNNRRAIVSLTFNTEDLLTTIEKDKNRLVAGWKFDNSGLASVLRRTDLRLDDKLLTHSTPTLIATFWDADNTNAPIASASINLLDEKTLQNFSAYPLLLNGKEIGIIILNILPLPRVAALLAQKQKGTATTTTTNQKTKTIEPLKAKQATALKPELKPVGNTPEKQVGSPKTPEPLVKLKAVTPKAAPEEPTANETSKFSVSNVLKQLNAVPAKPAVSLLSKAPVPNPTTLKKATVTGAVAKAVQDNEIAIKAAALKSADEAKKKEEEERLAEAKARSLAKNIQVKKPAAAETQGPIKVREESRGLFSNSDAVGLDGFRASSLMKRFNKASTVGTTPNTATLPIKTTLPKSSVKIPQTTATTASVKSPANTDQQPDTETQEQTENRKDIANENNGSKDNNSTIDKSENAKNDYIDKITPEDSKNSSSESKTPDQPTTKPEIGANSPLPLKRSSSKLQIPTLKVPAKKLQPTTKTTEKAAPLLNKQPSNLSEPNNHQSKLSEPSKINSPASFISEVPELKSQTPDKSVTNLKDTHSGNEEVPTVDTPVPVLHDSDVVLKSTPLDRQDILAKRKEVLKARAASALKMAPLSPTSDSQKMSQSLTSVDLTQEKFGSTDSVPGNKADIAASPLDESTERNESEILASDKLPIAQQVSNFNDQYRSGSDILNDQGGSEPFDPKKYIVKVKRPAENASRMPPTLVSVTSKLPVKITPKAPVRPIDTVPASSQFNKNQQALNGAAANQSQVPKVTDEAPKRKGFFSRLKDKLRSRH